MVVFRSAKERYLPHSMPHIPLYVPDDVRDPDSKKAYINTIEHFDSEIGRLLETLDEPGLALNTFVIFTSDNGPAVVQAPRRLRWTTARRQGHYVRRRLAYSSI